MKKLVTVVLAGLLSLPVASASWAQGAPAGATPHAKHTKTHKKAHHKGSKKSHAKKTPAAAPAK